MAGTEKNNDLKNKDNRYRDIYSDKGRYGSNLQDMLRESANSAGNVGKTASKSKKGNKKSNKNRSNKKRTKKKNGMLGPLIGLLFGSGTVAILLLIVLLVEFVGKSGSSNAGYDVNGSSGKHYDADEEYINIDADSFMGYVGQSYTLSLSANPVELVESVVWSSSNEDAVIVDEKGNVVLVGVGVAAITATSGEYSSAIAIEVVKDASSKGNMGFDTIGQNKPRNEDDNVYEESGQTTDSDMTQSGAQDNGQVSVPDAGSNADGSNTWNTGSDADAVPDNTQESTQQPSVNEETTQQETETEFIPPTTQPAEAIDTEQMFSVLSGSGFSQYLPNAAIYEVDGEYYGEVIVQSDSVHIYIKQRSSDFDMAVRGALAYLLPDTSESVWNVYTTLSKDKTINSDGRKVRFVMPATNAHSQIIVYNP